MAEYIGQALKESSSGSSVLLYSPWTDRHLETLDGVKRRGFLSAVIEPLLDLRLETVKLKKIDPKYKGLDSVLIVDAGDLFRLNRLQEREVWLN